MQIKRRGNLISYFEEAVLESSTISPGLWRSAHTASRIFHHRLYRETPVIIWVCSVPSASSPPLRYRLGWQISLINTPGNPADHLESLVCSGGVLVKLALFCPAAEAALPITHYCTVYPGTT